MNYLEFQLGGKLRGFKMGLGFLGDVLKHYDTDIKGFGEFAAKNMFHATPTVIYYAHYHDCLRKGIPVTFSTSNVSDWLDELDNPFEDKNIQALMSMLLDTIMKYLPDATEEKEDGDTEKKS